MMVRRAGGLEKYALYEVRQLLEAGYTAKELRDAGFVLEVDKEGAQSLFEI